MTAPANNYLFPPFVGAFGSPSGLFAPMGRVTLTSGANTFNYSQLGELSFSFMM